MWPSLEFLGLRKGTPLRKGVTLLYMELRGYPEVLDFSLSREDSHSMLCPQWMECILRWNLLWIYPTYHDNLRTKLLIHDFYGVQYQIFFPQKWIIHCQDQGLLTLVLISQCFLKFLSFQRWYIFGVVLTRLALFCVKNQDIDHGNTSQDISALRQTKIMVIQLKWFKWNFIQTTSYIGLFLHIHWRYVAGFIILMPIRLFVAPVALPPGVMDSVFLSHIWCPNPPQCLPSPSYSAIPFCLSLQHLLH